MLDSGAPMALSTSRLVPFEVQVPSAATNLEVWFESRGPSGTTGWDSRYGQNYSFVVLAEGLPVPEPSVIPRAGAVIDTSKIRVLEDAASKETSESGSSGRRLHTGLLIRAEVSDPAADTWADIHIFDAASELIHAGSVMLQQRGSAVEGALFVWEDDIYQGSGGGSGVGVWVRPDAHALQYRLYCRTPRLAFEAPAPVFTDGVLHEFELPPDDDVSRA